MALPLTDDPLANDIADIWKTNLAVAHATAREWTRKFAAK